MAIKHTYSFAESSSSTVDTHFIINKQIKTALTFTDEGKHRIINK